MEPALVDLSNYLLEDDDPPDDGDAEDLVALDDYLTELNATIASTNGAVLAGARGDPAAAGARVQASVKALKRFSEAFTVLEGGARSAAGDGAEG